jgi:hypothetical protein
MGTLTSARRRTAAAVGVALLLLLAGGCSASRGGADSSTAYDSAGGAPADGGAEVAPGAAQSAPDSAQQAAASSGEQAAAAAREVVTTGTATIISDKPADAAQRLSVLTERAGGRVEAREERRGSATEPPSAHLVLRLPSDRVTSTVQALGNVGKVVDVTISKEDVTATGRDLDARIAALETSTDRLLELMSNAANTGDLLKVEEELSSRQADLDALRAQRADLSDRVAMSTLEVTVTADKAAAAALSPSPGFRGGLEAGWHALVATGRVVAVTLGAVLPWLVVGGVLFVVGRAAYRGVLRVLARRSPAEAEAEAEAP